MRISDWSSDVCSSDLESAPRERRFRSGHAGSLIHARPVGGRGVSGPLGQRPDVAHQMKKQFAGLLEVHHVRRMFEPEEDLGRRPQLCEPGGGHRSEEQTSELPSLMRNSSAGLWFKKTKKKKQ